MGYPAVAVEVGVAGPVFNHVDDVCLAGDGAAGQSAAEYLGERGEVGHDAEVLLGAAARGSEAGDDLVEDEDDAVALGDFAELVEELRLDGLESHVGARGFEDDGGYVVVAPEGALERLDVVGRQDYHGAERLFGDAADALGSGDEVVAPAVEVVVELDDLGLAGVGARHADRHHVGFGAGAVEADFFGAGYEFADPVGPLDFELGGAGEVCSARHLFLDGADDFGAGVSEDEGAVSREVVEDAVAVYVVLGGAFGVGVVELEGVLASGVVGYAVWEEVAGFFVHTGGVWV